MKIEDMRFIKEEMGLSYEMIAEGSVLLCVQCFKQSGGGIRDCHE